MKKLFFVLAAIVTLVGIGGMIIATFSPDFVSVKNWIKNQLNKRIRF